MAVEFAVFNPELRALVLRRVVVRREAGGRFKKTLTERIVLVSAHTDGVSWCVAALKPSWKTPC